MIVTVKNESPFQILSSSFSIGPSETGYDLQVGADSRNFTTLFSVGANTPRMVTNVANGSYFRLKNNVGDVKVNWQRVCTDEGGGGASGTELSPVSEFPLGAEAGTVIAYSGSSSAAGIYQFDGTDWVEAGGNTEDIELPIAAAVNDLKSNIEARLDQQYYKKKEVNDITARKVEASQVDTQIKDYVDPAIAEVNETIEDKELPVSAAINDLNTNKVSGVGITKIQEISQADYDALTVKDPTTLYIIK